jgi:tetratricopeptide (TPR) repeat protein
MNANPTTASAWVQAGFQAQQQGDAERAERAYQQALQLHAEHPAALQLLGGLLRRRGDTVQAEALLRRSLAADASQAHVWNNLGNLLLASARADEALVCYDRALALQPAYADAHYNRARALHALARLPEAAASLNQALEAAPQPTLAMLQLHAQIEGDSGLVDSALRTLDKALTVAPKHLGLLHNRAVLLQRQQRHAEALAAHEHAAALGLDAADAHYNRGNTLQSLGRPADAAAAYRQALARDGGHALALFDLARLRWRQGEADFDAELRAAQNNGQAAPALSGLHAHLLWRAERYADAAKAYRSALAALPQAPGLHDGLARCLVRLGALEEGLAAHRQALSLAPDDAELHSHHAASLLVAGRPDAALAAAEAACLRAPLHQHAQALRVLAWRLLGDARAEWAAGADGARGLVQFFDLKAPPGFADMASFNSALAAELRALHGDHQAPIDQTLRGGTQTLGNIFDQGHPLVDALKARITEAVGRYIANLPEDATHPFLARRVPAAPGAATTWRYTDSWPRLPHRPCASPRLGQLGLLRERAAGLHRRLGAPGLAALRPARSAAAGHRSRQPGATRTAAGAGPAGAVSVDGLARHTALRRRGRAPDHRLRRDAGVMAT